MAATTTAREHRVVCLLWEQIEVLLSSSQVETEWAIRDLKAGLPSPAAFEAKDLSGLARLHLHSADNLMVAMRTLAPAAFHDGSSQPDLSAVASLDSAMNTCASILIELQLFHLERAAALAAHRRRMMVPC